MKAKTRAIGWKNHMILAFQLFIPLSINNEKNIITRLKLRCETFKLHESNDQYLSLFLKLMSEMANKTA